MNNNNDNLDNFLGVLLFLLMIAVPLYILYIAEKHLNKRCETKLPELQIRHKDLTVFCDAGNYYLIDKISGAWIPYSEYLKNSAK